jgi:S1-C subfamily serine protease
LGFGTGFFVTAQGHALTNDHVAGECSAVTAIVDGRRLPAQLIQRDERNDLALLRVQTSGAVPYAFFRSQTIRAGDDVAAVGFPLPDALSNTLNFSRGNIQALSGVGGNAGLFTMNAPINPGNSGGPVLDMGGNVVGIAVSRLESAQNVNFAIKQAVAQALLEAHDVAFEERPMTDRPLPPADLRDKGKTFTFQIECRS